MHTINRLLSRVPFTPQWKWRRAINEASKMFDDAASLYADLL